MRLYDRIMKYGLTQSEEFNLTLRGKFRDNLFDELTNAVVIQGDNVAAYLDGNRDKRQFTVDDLPQIAPPFPICFIEYDHRSAKRNGLPYEVGILVRSYDVWIGTHSEEDRHEQSAMLLSVWIEQQQKRAVAMPDDYTFDPVGLRWAVEMSGFLANGRVDTVSGPCWSESILVKGDGRVLQNESGPYAGTMLLPPKTPPEFVDAWLTAYKAYNGPAWFVFGFMNCRNVVFDEHFPSRQERRLAERTNSPPPTKYYTLRIEPIRKVLADRGKSEEAGLARALHICRGHFSHYTEEKPMFGKYPGTFWVPSHVRGTTEAGTIIKDYRVKAPKERAA